MEDKISYSELGARLATIAQMEPDGLFLDVNPPNDDQLKWFMSLIAEIDNGAPWVYIAPDGELFANWTFEKFDIDAYFNFATKRIVMEVYTRDFEFVVENAYSFEEWKLADHLRRSFDRFK